MMSLGTLKANIKRPTPIFSDSPSFRCSKITWKCFKAHLWRKTSHLCLPLSFKGRLLRLVRGLISRLRSSQGLTPLVRSPQSSPALNQVATSKTKMFKFNKICNSSRTNLSRRNALFSRKKLKTLEPTKVKIWWTRTCWPNSKMRAKTNLSRHNKGLTTSRQTFLVATIKTSR